MTTTQQSNAYTLLLSRHKNNPLMTHMENMLKSLNVNPLQVKDFDDSYGIHVVFFKDGREYSVAIQDNVTK